MTEVNQIVADYIASLKAGLSCRQGQCQSEDGSTVDELWEVEKDATPIYSYPARWNPTKGDGVVKGWMEALLVTERIIAGDTGWGEVKIHLLYIAQPTPDYAELDHVLEVDISNVRRIHERCGDDSEVKTLDRCADTLTRMGIINRL